MWGKVQLKIIWVYFLYSCNTVYRKGVGRHNGQRNMSSWKMGNCIGLFLQLGGNGKSLERNVSVAVEFVQPFALVPRGAGAGPLLPVPSAGFLSDFP